MMMEVHGWSVATYEFHYISGEETEILRDHMNFTFMITQLSLIYNMKTVIRFSTDIKAS